MRLFPFVALSAALLTACGRDTDPASEADRNAQAAFDAGAIPQKIDVRVDGKKLTTDPDRPMEGRVVMAAIHDNVFTLAVLDDASDADLTIEAPFPGTPKAGELHSYVCKAELGCEEPPRERPRIGSLLTTALKENGPLPRSWHAYKAPKLNLQPLVVRLTSVEPTTWPGAGSAYRVKGTFQGTFADAVIDWQHPRVNGPLRQVEGSFDIYALSR